MVSGVRYFFLILLSSGCLANDDQIFITSEQIEFLLSSDSCKAWELVNRTVNEQTVLRECDKDDLLTFCNPNGSQDTAIFDLSNGIVLCIEQSDSLTFHGYWFVTDTAGIQRLSYVVDEDTILHTVNLISSQILTLTFENQGQLVEEQYLWSP